jgi:hypothetical protein
MSTFFIYLKQTCSWMKMKMPPPLGQSDWLDIPTSNSFKYSWAEIEQFRTCLASVKCSTTGRDEYLSLHPVCAFVAVSYFYTDWDVGQKVCKACLSSDECQLSKTPGTLRCIRCLHRTRKLCPCQVDFWVARIAEELSKPLESIASMFELYGRNRITTMQPENSPSDDESDTSDNASEASYRPKSGPKPEKTVTCRSSRARGGLGNREETQEVMAKVTKTLANMTEIEKRRR